MIDPKNAIAVSRSNCSNLPVVTSRYMIEVVMNDAYIERTPEEHKKELAAEIQRALDAGFFEDIRYDYIEFDVNSREELDVAPANDPE